MQFRYTPTFGDYWRLNFDALRKQLWLITPIAAGSLLFFLLYPFVVHDAGNTAGLLERYRGAWALLALPLMVLLTFAATGLGAFVRWKTRQDLRREKTFQIDKASVRIQSGAGAERVVNWSEIADAAVTKRFVHMSTEKEVLCFFPRTAVSEIEHLGKLIRTKVKGARVDKGV